MKIKNELIPFSSFYCRRFCRYFDKHRLVMLRVPLFAGRQLINLSRFRPRLIFSAGILAGAAVADSALSFGCFVARKSTRSVKIMAAMLAQPSFLPPQPWHIPSTFGIGHSNCA
jgi:hypothetical protein